VNYIGFIIAASILIHLAIELIILNNPIGDARDTQVLNSRKYYKIAHVEERNIAMHDDSSDEGENRLNADNDEGESASDDNEPDFNRLVAN